MSAEMDLMKCRENPEPWTIRATSSICEISDFQQQQHSQGVESVMNHHEATL